MISLSARARATFATVHRHPSLKRDDVLKQPHRSRFTVDVELQVFEPHELDPVALHERVDVWLLDQYAVNAGEATTVVIARQLLDQLRVWYGDTRGARVEVLEQGDSGAVASLPFRAGPGRHPRPITPE